jgi:hypothetical protein
VPRVPRVVLETGGALPPGAPLRSDVTEHAACVTKVEGGIGIEGVEVLNRTRGPP